MFSSCTKDIKKEKKMHRYELATLLLEILTVKCKEHTEK